MLRADLYGGDDGGNSGSDDGNEGNENRSTTLSSDEAVVDPNGASTLKTIRISSVDLAK